jgi:hypothetical protein
MQKKKPATKAARMFAPGLHERARLAYEASLRRSVKRERRIQSLERALKRARSKSDADAFELAQSLVGPDYRLVPASSPAAAVNG